MMFSLTAAQQIRHDELVAFAQQELGADLRERDHDGTFSRTDWQRCGDQGVLGSHVPTAYGGEGLDAASTVLALEAVGYGCRDNGLTLALGGQIWSIQEPIVVYGNEEQKQRFLPRLCSGELIGAHGVTEPTSGSDALSLETTAVRRGDGYVLNGRKAYIGMAPESDLALVLANTDPLAGKWGISAFLVETGTDGFTRSPPRPKMGTRTNPLGDLILDDCFVPETNRLGKEGIGVSIVTQTLGWERAFIHAGHLGAMQALLERCVAYARERRQFGQARHRHLPGP